MMILISGQPGNGKTLKALALMVEEYERNQRAVKTGKEQPRQFFTNITGVTFDWVKPIPFVESEDTPEQQRRPDWRLCPDGAYIVYDECHADGKTEKLERYGILFPATGKPGESDDPRIRAMSTHRHSGIDMVFVTQWPNKVHHNVRTLVGKHIHMNRAMGMERAGVVQWGRVQVDPYDEKAREKAEEEIWTFPRDLFDKYMSATLHTQTYKFKIPKKVWGALSTACMLGLLLWGTAAYFAPDDVLAKTQGLQSEKPAAARGEGALAPAGPQASRTGSVEGYREWITPVIPEMPWTAPAFEGRQVQSEPRVLCSLAGAGLDANGAHVESSCHCLTEQGTRYRMPRHRCEYLAENGEAYNPFKAPARDAGVPSDRLDDVDQGGGVSPPAAAVGAGSPGFGGQQAAYGAFRG